ncbi:MAG: LysM peptidoglycan-binding domain-containing protein [Caldilineaceae bacterium]|nr:LysM peptidoglycan-binding domain-containing protein [Caldilineaceae bacterium]
MTHPRRLWMTIGKIVILSLLLISLGSTAALADENVHIVQPGDTLSQIAQKYGTNVETLRSLNNLTNANFVWAGQRLLLPTDTARTVNPANSRAADLDTTTYTVKPGDTLFSIAAAHRISLAWLAEENRVNPGQRLTAGRELTVPAGFAASGSEDAEQSRIHVVEAGQSIGSIANLYDTTARAIIRANNLADANRISPGQKLVIAPPALHERMGMSARVDENGFLVYTEYPTTTEKWIAVDLSEQRVTAYEGTTPIRSFVVSTGLPATPTVTGSFRIWAKTPLQDMYGGNRAAGTYYYLSNVPWVQYFYEDYAFHGTTWHANFGRPASRGCINMRTDEAKWLFEWAEPVHTSQGWFISNDENPGTLVIVHQ